MNFGKIVYSLNYEKQKEKRLVYLFDPAAPCSYWSPVSPAPAVPFAIPLVLAISRASSGFVPILIRHACGGINNYLLIMKQCKGIFFMAGISLLHCPLRA